MSPNVVDQRQARLIGRVAQKEGEQNRSRIESLRARPDFKPELDYFIRLLENPAPAAAAERAGRPLVGLLCLQAPLELFHALDLQPFKIYSGSYVTGQLAANNLPAIMCPCCVRCWALCVWIRIFMHLKAGCCPPPATGW